MLGDRVGLTGDAHVDASGESGGGTVLVGGDYQGKNRGRSECRARTSARMPAIRADATDNGDGGKVIVWSDESTRAYGSISARGGATAAMAVRRNLRAISRCRRNRVNTAAPGRQGGTWLLDP